MNLKNINIDSLFNHECSTLFNCIDLIICTLEFKNKPSHEKYHNWFTFGMFSNSDSLVNNLKSDGRYKINDNTNLLFFIQNVSFDFIKKLLQSYNGTFCKAGKTNFNANLSQYKESRISRDEIQSDSFKGLISQDREYHGFLAEFFDTYKNVQTDLTIEEIKKINYYIKLKTSGLKIEPTKQEDKDKLEGIINLNIFNDKIGNFLFFLPDERFNIDFHGHRQNNDLYLKILSHPKFDNFSDLQLNITTVRHGEITNNLNITPPSKFQVIPDFWNEGEIYVNLWRANSELLFYDHAERMNTLDFSLNLSSGAREFKDDEGNNVSIDISEPIQSLIIGKQFNSRHWSNLINNRKISLDKQKLLEQMKMIHLPNGSRKIAIESIREIINLCKDYIKIWDPYLSGKDLINLLPYRRNTQIPVYAITDLNNISNIINDISEIPAIDFKNLVLTKVSSSDKSFLNNFYEKNQDDLYILGNYKMGIIKEVRENPFIGIIDLFLDKKIDKYLGNICKIKKSEIEKIRRILESVGFTKMERIKNIIKNDLVILKNEKKFHSPVNIRYNTTEKELAFHDRFIITKNRVWSLGSSINHIGEKHSVIQEVGYPELIEQEFDILWNKLENSEI